MLPNVASPLRAVRAAPLESHVGAAVAVALGWVYLPTLAKLLLGRWRTPFQYSHTSLVPRFVAYLLRYEKLRL